MTAEEIIRETLFRTWGRIGCPPSDWRPPCDDSPRCKDCINATIDKLIEEVKSK